MVTKPLDRLRQAKAVAIFRHPRPVDLVGLVESMIEGGWKAIEITSDTPGAIAAVTTCKRRFGNDLFIGVGTVTRPDVAREALDAGANFIVSPVHVKEVTDVVRDSDALGISGGLTPNEVFRAWEDGADVIKLFPALSVGVDYITQLRGPFPHIPLLPTGGIDVPVGRRLLELGAIAVGVGAAAIDFNAVEVQRWAWVREHAEVFLHELSAES